MHSMQRAHACIACRQHPRLSRAKFHFRNCGSLDRWPQGGMRPVKMVLRLQVCECVIECDAGLPTWKLGCPFLQSTLQKVVKRGHFFEKVAFQDTVGRIMHEPPRRQKWVTLICKPEQRTVLMGTPIRATHCPSSSKPEGKSVILSCPSGSCHARLCRGRA